MRPKCHPKVTFGRLWGRLSRKFAEKVTCCENISFCYVYTTKYKVYRRHFQDIWPPKTTPGASKDEHCDHVLPKWPQICAKWPRRVPNWRSKGAFGHPNLMKTAPSGHRMCKGHPRRLWGCLPELKMHRNHTKFAEWIRIYEQSEAEIW